MGKQWKQCQTLFWGAPKSLQMVTAAMKLKDAYSLEEKSDTLRGTIDDDDGKIIITMYGRQILFYARSHLIFTAIL